MTPIPAVSANVTMASTASADRPTDEVAEVLIHEMLHMMRSMFEMLKAGVFYNRQTLFSMRMGTARMSRVRKESVSSKRGQKAASL